MKTIAAIGAGITGVTTDYALAKPGYRVTVIGKHRHAGSETSLANGGQLSASNADVWSRQSGNSTCVFYNTGHGHLGWTLSALTADMIGDVIRHSPPVSLH